MCQAAFRDDGALPFRLLSEKPFLLPDNEGVKMNTSPVRMDDLPLKPFSLPHCCAHFRRTPDRRLCSRRHWLRHYSAYARHATDAVYGGNDRRLGAPWFVPWQPGSWVDLRPYWSAKNLHLQLFADYACFVFTIFCHHARASYWTAHFDWHWSGRRLFSRSHLAG
ncbi:major facilitator superfamily protein [Escherichia coli]|nr:major facilitator superfamily protein [Escherichia coli]